MSAAEVVVRAETSSVRRAHRGATDQLIPAALELFLTRATRTASSIALVLRIEAQDAAKMQMSDLVELEQRILDRRRRI
jgi:hypothetical protein